MAKITLSNGVSAANFRTYLNSMFSELYTYGFLSEKLSRSGGTPSTGDPASFDSVSHTLVGTYTATPIAIIIPKSDWHVYISSVSTTTVVVGIGSAGSGTAVDYDIIIISLDIA